MTKVKVVSKNEEEKQDTKTVSGSTFLSKFFSKSKTADQNPTPLTESKQNPKVKTSKVETTTSTTTPNISTQADSTYAKPIPLIDLAKGSKSMIQALESLIEAAYEQRASDIHIDPSIDGVKVRFRIDGILTEVCRFPKSDFNELVTRVKVVANLRTDEHQVAQDGRFRHMIKDEPVDIRVSIIPTYHGENAVLRLLAGGQQTFNLETLGYSVGDREKLMRALKKPYGMILATGPTGSGKTTTLYTCLQMLNNPDISIITLEDPVEYAIEGIEQIQVNPRTNLTFANGLRAILRQDPNVIMVGEIRDQETAGLAVNTALTGHLVLSTLHTNDAATTLPRLLDLKVEPYLIASTVTVAIGQRLVRKICQKCKSERKLTAGEIQSLSSALPSAKLYENSTTFEGKGCENCNLTGYKGRIGIYEVMEISPAIREAILQKASATRLKEIACKEGMTSMLEDGYTKANAGLTTISEILRMFYD